MIKKGDTVIYNGETVKVMATPETVGFGDPKSYLIEGYSGGWYPLPGQPNGIYGVHMQKKYFWVTDSRDLLPVNSAPITPGMYRILDTHNVRDYLGQHAIGQLVTVSAKEAELLNKGQTVVLDNNKWGINFTAGDLSRATDVPVETSRYKVGERVIYKGSEAVVARVDRDNVYIIELFNGDGWSGKNHQGLSPTGKYWAVSDFDLKPSPVQTKMRMVDPVPAGMASMIDPYHYEKRVESSRVERSLHTGDSGVLSGSSEIKSDKPVTNQPPDAYIQQPIIVTKRKTKHTLKIV